MHDHFLNQLDCKAVHPILSSLPANAAAARTLVARAAGIKIGIVYICFQKCTAHTTLASGSNANNATPINIPRKYNKKLSQ